MSCCCCSVSQLHQMLCDPRDCSMPGLSVPHHLPKFSKFISIVLMIPFSHLILWCPLLLLPSVSRHQGFFPMRQLFTSDEQNTGVSASALVLPSVQGWFPLRAIGLMSLLSKELWRVFSSTIVWRHQFNVYLLSIIVENKGKWEKP